MNRKHESECESCSSERKKCCEEHFLVPDENQKCEFKKNASLERTQLYKTVVIDPPWTVVCGFTKEKFYRIGRKLPYKTMSDQEIAEFPIDDFADEECDLFLWVTHTKLPAGLKIIEKWGFKYHALIVWDKLGGVCINGFYRNTEFAIYAYRGKLGVDVSKGCYIPTLFKAKATKHSEKPSRFYSVIRERTQEPRIDIFARRRHFGFDVYGDQVEGEIQVPLNVGLGSK